MDALRILVLDDEAIFRTLLGDYFNEIGHTAFTAEKPSQAFGIMEEENIDVALVDVFLPEMNGIQVIQQIKERYTNVDAVAITGGGEYLSNRTNERLQTRSQLRRSRISIGTHERRMFFDSGGVAHF
jgi:DNA-binding NtrC family response regulator